MDIRENSFWYKLKEKLVPILMVIVIAILIWIAFGNKIPGLIPLLKEGDGEKIADYLAQETGIKGVIAVILLQMIQVVSIVLPGMAIQVAAGLIYGWLLVRGLNVYLDGGQGEIFHAEVVDTHMPDFRYGANLHRDRFFTVALENGEQLDLFTPDDVYVEKDEGDDVTVALHKGALGIAWAEFV